MLLPFAVLVAVQADPDATRVILERGWLDNVAIVGQSLVSLLVLILLVTATFALLALRRALDELTRLVRSTSADITGAVHDARKVVEELRMLSGRVRGTADAVRVGVEKVRGVMGRPHGSEERSLERSEMSREERLRRRRRRRRGSDRPRPSEGGEAAEGPGESAE
jgi:hypothetical protein